MFAYLKQSQKAKSNHNWTVKNKFCIVKFVVDNAERDAVLFFRLKCEIILHGKMK